MHPVSLTLPHAPITRGLRPGIVRGISYGLFGKPDVFIPQTRALGAGLVRVYVYWSQVEPQPGHYTWDAVDAVLQQLDGNQEVWITLCSSSPWATRTSTDFLPPSPALDLAAYAEFVRRVVRRCAGRVTYWQCDNEPSNADLLWAGTPVEYTNQLTTMYAAVKEVDPAAMVVLGGCGYDVFSSEAGSEQRRFFDSVTGAGRDAFDVFDVHLYGEPYCIPDYVQTARQFMRTHGYCKPVVAGEYAGPSLFEFPEVESIMQQSLASAFAAAPATQSTQELKEQVGQDTPERRAMKVLYSRMADLPPTMQMFMAGCPPELEAKRHRISCRQLVIRNLLALAEGIQRTSYWNLANEVPGPVDPYTIMHLLFSKLPLMEYTGDRLDRRLPEADTFALLVDQLAGATAAHRVRLLERPEVYAFRVEYGPGCAPLTVAWERRGALDGECLPSTPVRMDWDAEHATAHDVFGNMVPTRVIDGTLEFDVADTPVFVRQVAGA
jgi:hypothetical protein